MPLKQRVAARPGGTQGGRLNLNKHRSDMYRRVQGQLIDPSFFGVLVAWAPIFMTAAAVYMGMADMVEGVTRPLKPVAVMTTYNYLFKLMGPIFPFMILGIRIILIATCLITLAPGAPLLNVNDHRITFIFVAITCMRALVYGTTLLSSRESMSDHIFMGTSLVVLARIEMHAALDILCGDQGGAVVLSVRKKKSDGEGGKEGGKGAEEPPAPPPTLGNYKFLFLIPFLLSVLLIALTHANNYVTARYFHSKEESQAAVLCGILLFEAPACMWMMQSSGYSIFTFQFWKSQPKQDKAVKELEQAAE
mmetsp:Transcript_5533/g.13428  ORF Transcript_5533/g.13428 Transcript_5533/m.13428 type:complete len:306 (-) Transcript_5533:501-1418(-)